ncbi:MAG: hypothetical protein ACI9JN_000383 [Bacteroidia bacterium]|jgi:hypothetical protein
MWMQLKSILLVLFMSSVSANCYAQSTTDSSKVKQTLKSYTNEIKANFLSSYYEQDGNNAAVTGGEGTEQLTNLANVFTIHIPIDSSKAVSVYVGADNYSSASTDNIDNNVSSESSQDLRAFGTVSLSKLNLKKNETYSLKTGFSVEYDYTSFSVGGSYTKEWNDANSEITFVGQAFFDTWSLIYPVELRGRVNQPSAARQSYNGQILFSQVINKRLQLGLTGEVIYMNGLLSTPFHRVYFSDQTLPDIERLPTTRLKIPLSIRLNYYPFDKLVLRNYYRFYTDDFGIRSHTFEFETPLKITKAITIAPFYRYHTQSASDFFATIYGHLSTDVFYTSDYDLSALNSSKLGIGLKYYPLYGILRSKPFTDKKRIMVLKYIDLRGAYYTRNTGLTAYIGSVNLAFSIK